MAAGAEVIPDSVIAGLWAPRFPSPEMVRAAAAMFPPGELWRGEEGPHLRLVVAPGVVAIEGRYLALRSRSAERQAAHREHYVDQLAIAYNDRGEFPEFPSRSEVTEWSRKSRSRMTRRLAEVDWAPLSESGRLPAMITLTYPGDWETVCPDGQTVKGHFFAFLRRWERAWAEPFTGAWKLEFQARGAPHFHLYCCPPLDGRIAGAGRSRPAAGDGLTFHHWLSVVWADVVAHPDPVEYMNHLAAGTGVDLAEGLRYADPKRIAVYFTKHGMYASKEYQHSVPGRWRAPGKGPGRFWGYRNLDRAVAFVELGVHDADRLARTLRRWGRAQGLTREVWAPRVRGGRVRPVYPDVIGLTGLQLVAARRERKRRVRRRRAYLKCGAGFVCVNDGPALAAALSRLLVRE
jgi:hypothetical protein